MKILNEEPVMSWNNDAPKAMKDAMLKRNFVCIAGAVAAIAFGALSGAVFFLLAAIAIGFMVFSTWYEKYLFEYGKMVKLEGTVIKEDRNDLIRRWKYRRIYIQDEERNIFRVNPGGSKAEIGNIVSMYVPRDSISEDNGFWACGYTPAIQIVDMTVNAEDTDEESNGDIQSWLRKRRK